MTSMPGEALPSQPNRVPRLLFHDQVPAVAEDHTLKSPRDTDWMKAGHCRDESPSVMVPEDEEGEERAKRFCATCPAVASCLEYALANRIAHGVWGGANERERRKMIRLRRANGQ